MAIHDLKTMIGFQNSTDNKWYISSNDNPTFRSIASEL